MSWDEFPQPVGRQVRKAAAVRRRTLLGTLAATPFISIADKAEGKEDECPNLLAFEISPDGRTVRVREREQSKPSTKSEHAIVERKPDIAHWQLPAQAFGPKAWFDMPRPADTSRLTLRVRRVRYGKLPEVTLELRFARGAKSWTLALATDLWAPKRAMSVSEPVMFAEFIGVNRWLRLPSIGAGAAGRTVREIFDAHLDVAPSAQPFETAFDSHLTWRLIAPSGAGVVALDRQVVADDFMFAWAEVTPSDGPAGGARDNPPGSATGYTFFGRASVPGARPRPSIQTTDQLLPFRFEIGSAKGHHLLVERSHPSEIVLDARIASSPLQPKQEQTVVGLRLGPCMISVCDGTHPAGRVIAGPLRASRVVLTTASLPQSELGGPMRTVLWGDAEGGGEITSPVGPLLVGPPNIDSPVQPDSAKADRTQLGGPRFQQAATGDRGGARGATLFAVHDQAFRAGAAHPGLRRIAIDLALQRASLAPPDTSYSDLRFEDADMRLSFEDGAPLFTRERSEFPTQRATSWVWVGPRSAPSAFFDLSRATLTCARDADLAKVRFRFSDLVLAVDGKPTLRPARDDCRVVVAKGVVHDSRPVLVVEFDPQHVMEEAVFRPSPPPPPDVSLHDRPQEMILAELAKCADEAARVTLRQEIQAAKVSQEATGRPPPVFTPFAKAFNASKEVQALDRADQQVYIGPFALDPDAMALARKVAQDTTVAAMRMAVTDTFKRLNALTQPPNAFTKLLRPVNSDRGMAPFASALRNEALFEQQETLYALFRDHWREQLARALVRPSGSPLAAGGLPLDGIPDTVRPCLAEYLLEGNRPPTYPGNVVDGLVEKLLQGFAELLLGGGKLDTLMQARLSGGTRLAFSLNCQPLAGLDAEEAGLDGWSHAGPDRPGDGHASFDALPFTFDALTDWSRHEPAVTRRARKLFLPLASGLVPPLGNRAAEANDLAILADQGISPGLGTAASRLGEVRASLAVRPTAFETAIEIPSRLILSTAQDAVWLTNRTVVGAPHRDDVIELDGMEIIRPGAPLLTRPMQRLWTVRLAIGDVPPSLRAVGSPDLRIMALGSALSRNGAEPPGTRAPPSGPWAPWFLGAEASDAAETCPPQPDQLYRLYRWLCERADARRTLSRSNQRIFRTSLDANDRHQLVLQTSAYGLPVIGKREVGADSKLEIGGVLTADSGQIEPGSNYALLDARDGQAIYRPIPLAVQELSLSALGGSFLHDTRFIPAAGAIDLDGRSIFDGFSIERYQHEVVLGRDVRAEVVYRGYLMPLCHRASLVKLTERVFLRVAGHGIKAILRQRMFIKVGAPTVRYPALGQPHEGRLWCAKIVTITTLQTPDLLDPTLPTMDILNGRVLDAQPGLVFWPRTDVTETGLVMFDVDFDGAVARMPLLFLDTIAATQTLSLTVAAKHYNADPQRDRRRVTFNGQKLQYAPESSPGDTTLSTNSIDVLVVGRLQPDTSRWTGRLDSYVPTPVLEGANQPSFYPALDTAEIRLSHVERMTGGQPAPVCAQYDGHYILKGFDRDLAGGNPLGIFLDLRRAVPLSMGSNGDRAAAIGRPETDLIAISRGKGPLGLSGTVHYALNPAMELGGAVTLSAKADLSEWVSHPGLVSAVGIFSRDPSASPSSALAEAPATASAGGAQNWVKKFFNLDAKLLGTITLQDLLAFMGETGLEPPELKEAIEYGSAAVDGLAADVRTRVLQPLRATVVRLQAEWFGLVQRLQQTAAIPLATLFPEMTVGLADLRATLDEALATEDALALPDKLARVFAAGQGLAHTVATLAAHPVERIEAAASGLLGQQFASLRRQLDDWAKIAEQFRAVARIDLPDALAETILGWMKQHLVNEAETTLAAWLPPPVQPVTFVLDDVPDEALAAKLKAAQNAMSSKLTWDSWAVVHDLLHEGLAGRPLDPVIRAAIGRYRAAATAARAAALQAFGEAKKDAEIVARGMIEDALDRVIDAAALDRPETLVYLRAAARAEQAIGSVRNLAAAVAVKPPRAGDILAAASDVAQNVFGLSADDLLTDFAAKAAPLLAALDHAVAPWRVGLDRPRLRSERVVCRLGDLTVLRLKNAAGAPVGSTALLTGLAAAIADADAVPILMTDIARALGEANLPPEQTTPLIAYCDAVSGIDFGDKLRTLYCALTECEAALLAIDTPPAVLDDVSINAWLATIAALRLAGSAVGQAMSALGDAITRLGEIAKTTRSVLAGALKALPEEALKQIDQALLQRANALEKRLAAALAGVVNQALALPRELATLGSLAPVVAAAGSLRDAVAPLGPPLTQDVEQLLAAVAAQQALMERWAGLKDVPAAPETIRDVLDATTERASALDAEQKVFADILAAAYRLRADMRGMPNQLRAAVETWTLDSLIPALGTLDAALLKLRDETLSQIDTVKLLSGAARRALLVPANPAYGTPACPVGTPGTPLPALMACDRVWQEGEILAAKVPLSDDARRHLLHYLASWRAGQSAPQLIVHQIEEIATEIARGDIIAALDLGAYRDQLEDAIAGLIPTRQTLAYDFTSHVESENEGGLFQPKRGGEFGIKVRATVDLLHAEKSTFAATAHFGAFDVLLIGSIIDALRLKFRGASFEAAQHAKPRFDILYDDFEIGEALSFAQVLQSYLSPGNGDGVFIQPMTEGAGLEVGYAVDLGIISLGETSFFNVKLGLSAELPFDQRDARFKVSLGRRLAPFTMSVLPFAGSGYFAVTANARGPIGFEAAFEFGGGGAIAFGPLAAQARIQVGVYIKLMKLDEKGGMSTTIAGTFFAGGSASIWIFSFQTSLAVSLGSDGNSMYGQATFSFSFSLGLCHPHYAVTATHGQPKLGGDKSDGSTSLEPPTQFAATFQPTVTDASDPQTRATLAAGLRPSRPHGRHNAHPQSEWDDYAKYFDPALLGNLNLPYPQ